MAKRLVNHNHSGAVIRRGRPEARPAQPGYVVPVLAAVLSGLFAYAAAVATNQNAIEVVKQTAVQSANFEQIKLDRDRKEAAYLAFLDAADALYLLRSAQWANKFAETVPNPIVRLPPPPLPDAAEVGRRKKELRSAENRILLVIGTKDIGTVTKLTGLLLRDSLQDFGDVAYGALRSEFVNTYRRDVLKLEELPPLSGFPFPPS